MSNFSCQILPPVSKWKQPTKVTYRELEETRSQLKTSCRQTSHSCLLTTWWCNWFDSR